MRGETSPRPTDRCRRWAAFAAAAAALTIIWGIVLPRLAETSVMRKMIQRNERLGIDPSAMFYSDLENMEYRDSMLRRRR